MPSENQINNSINTNMKFYRPLQNNIISLFAPFVVVLIETTQIQSWEREDQFQCVNPLRLKNSNNDKNARLVINSAITRKRSLFFALNL